MKLHEKLSIKIFQIFPEILLSEPFKNYCMQVAERELARIKQELVRKNWERANLECHLSKLRKTK